ncbi:MAG: SH3 domain-containing protein [Devosia sp.]
MSIKSNLIKAGALGAAITALTIGVASAAVATSSVNVRTGPSTSYRVVDTLRPGEQVNVVAKSNGWCRVTKAGPDGWVSCAYLADSRVRPPVYREPPSVNFSFGFGSPFPSHGWMHSRPPMHHGHYDRGSRWW